MQTFYATNHDLDSLYDLGILRYSHQYNTLGASMPIFNLIIEIYEIKKRFLCRYHEVFVLFVHSSI